jgi:GT2 family glycosyltransferase
MNYQPGERCNEVNSSPVISVVIVTYKSEDYITGCVNSIKEAARNIAHQIIIVDNASGEGLTELIRAEFPDVLLIENENNEGFARAVNRGARHATGLYLAVLNPDTLFHPDGLKTLMAFIKKQATACVVGPRTVDGEGNIAHSCHSLPHLGNLARYPVTLIRQGKGLKNPRQYLLDMWKPDRTVDLSQYNGYLQGSCLFMKLDFFRSMGMFDERYFLYAEDADFGLRVKKAGYPSFLVNEAEVLHVGKHVAAKDSRTTRYFVETYIQYIDKNLGLVHGSALKIALFILVIGWLIVTLNRGDKDRRKALTQALASFVPLRKRPVTGKV